jgi:cytochrome c biogenesis protein ResB
VADSDHIMKNFFLSLKTTVWLLLALIVMFFLGSYMMPAHRGIFGPMNDMLLFDWMQEVAFPNPRQTWWFFASLALLVLLTINTLVCSFQAIKGKWSRSDFLLRISPQIIHIGFLCILLAHLLGAGMGYRLSGMLPEGASAKLPEDRALRLLAVRVTLDPAGHPRDWGADVEVYEKGARVAAGSLGPNQPLFYQGTGIYLKSFDLDRVPSALLMVNKDPGALWALAGGMLFIIGSSVLLALKWKRA